MPTALFLSPHLDDVAFSCGATLAKLSANGWQTILCTIFTGSVERPLGFALACQTDKGLAPDVDYMAVRRAEDKKAAKCLGASKVSHLPYLEAPHRGYGSPQELFGPIRRDDNIWEQLIDAIHDACAAGDTDMIYVPQGIGGHVDHIQLITAFNAAGWNGPVRWYRDTPYIIRDPAARRSALVPGFGKEAIEPLDKELLQKKIAACTAYATQINFQFGSLAGVREKLEALAVIEAAGQHDAIYGERFWETR